MCFGENSIPRKICLVSVHVNIEKPKGVSTHVKAMYNRGPLVNEDGVSLVKNSKNPRVLKKLLFGLSFCHAVIEERLQFVPTSFRRHYVFNERDLRIGMSHIRFFVEQFVDIPYQDMREFLWQQLYGEQMEDEWDVRCLQSLVEFYISPLILNDSYQFTTSGEYRAPTEGPMSHQRAFIDSMPKTNSLEVLGLNQNAELGYQRRRVSMFKQMMETSFPVVDGLGMGFNHADRNSYREVLEEIVSELEMQVQVIEKRKFDYEEVLEEEWGTGMRETFEDEIEQFNAMARTVQREVIEIRRWIGGGGVDDEEVGHRTLVGEEGGYFLTRDRAIGLMETLLSDQAPLNWRVLEKKKRDETMEVTEEVRLIDWVKGIQNRKRGLEMMIERIEERRMMIVDIGVLKDPRAFFLCMEEQCEGYRFEFVREQNEVEQMDGLFCLKNLVLEGGFFDVRNRLLVEQDVDRVNREHQMMPLVVCQAKYGQEEQEGEDEGVESFLAPVYDDSDVVFAIELPSLQKSAVWQRRGVRMR
eukprot:TRINITY_DN3741_c0_g2_i2.p1 TRINITY_DN3741_c0_g2~~TRINITY_DN3741_c0_g2_i2.p1  ORF type:complete len:526 (-),score=176.37 TRINITY_DN3741_c0_g2_i2:100-1677(-)